MTDADEHRGAEESALLLAVRAGDEVAFAWLLDHHRDGLELYCKFMLGDLDAARQAMTETMLSAWRDRENVHAQTPARMWLYRIAAHVCFEVIADGAATDEFADQRAFDVVKRDERPEHAADRLD